MLMVLKIYLQKPQNFTQKFFFMHNNRGRTVKFMNFGRERHEFPALQVSTQQISDQKREKETEDRISCSLDQHQVTRKSFMLFYHFHYISP